MSKKKIYNRMFLKSVVVVGFLLAILDMFFLKGVFYDFFDFDEFGAAFSAFALASAANVTALLWGRQNGERESGKAFCTGWVFLGSSYFMLRTIPFMHDVVLAGDWSFDAVMKQLGPVLILAISYIGTGTSIEWASRRLWDADIVNYLKTKKLFETQHSTIANNRATLMKAVALLNNYQDNYDSLDRQYKKHIDKIRKSEHSVMSMIVGKTIADNKDVTPSVANKVMEEVLIKRDEKNERTHNQQI